MKKNLLFEKCLSNVAPEVWEKVRLKMDKDFANESLSDRAEVERFVEAHINKNQESYIMNENTKKRLPKRQNLSKFQNKIVRFGWLVS